jgi:hypothetical protein
MAVCFFKLNKMAQFIENVTRILRDKSSVVMVVNACLKGKRTIFFFERLCLEKITFVGLFHI